MKLAYLTSQYPASSHTFIRREVDALRRRGISIDTFSVRPPSEAERRAEADAREYGATFYSLPVRPARLVTSHLRAFFRRPLGYFGTLRRALRHRVPGARAFVWSLFHFAEAIELAVELERRGVTHVHNHFANPAANVGYLATSFAGLSWSLTLHGISEFDYPAGVLLADKIRAARHVACVSHFGRAQAMRIVEPEHWDKLFIVRCGIETDALPPRPAAEREAADDAAPLRLLCVGRLSPEKGIVGLLEAVALAVERGARVELRIAGDGPDAALVGREIERLGLGARVRLLGRLTEAEVLVEMAESDCFVSASLMEGLPVVLMESLGLGVPVIAPCVAGIPELVEQRVTGFLFSPGHWHELAERIVEAERDPSLRAALGAAGRARVFEEFDIDRAVVPLAARYGA